MKLLPTSAGIQKASIQNALVERLGKPSYAIDDQTALKVVDGAVEVISEGHWRRFVP